ncbi:LacI family DNA-binding transcriptional regulator [Neobacillus sp. 3P2-tot-E-2]|uniref:LacI family DNA-binding transcriptional regulator n=1 Tax=Neobacillus sp. 3P2-tot-E-2 TaxID=3132212 RepID=UPI0039A17088
MERDVMAKVTLKEIADATGFSVAKVSRAVNETGAIKKVDKEKILKVAEELGYNCKSKQAKNEPCENSDIAVLIPRFDSYQTSDFIQNLNSILLQKQYKIDYYTVEGTPLEESKLLRSIINKNYSAIVYKPLRVHEEVQAVINESMVPIFSYGQVYGNCININYNNFSLMYDLTKIAIENRSRKILYIGTFKTDIEVGFKRFEGFLQAVTESEVSYQYMECRCDIEESYKLSKTTDFSLYDAVICATDNLALGIHRGLLEKNIWPGKNILLSGVGNNKITRVVTPSLTTVDLDKNSVVEFILERLVKEQFTSVNYIVPYEIIRRESM